MTTDLVSNIALLRNVQDFSALEDESLRQMAEIAEYRHVERGEYLIHQGNDADNLFIVLKGRLHMRSDPRSQFFPRRMANGAGTGAMPASFGSSMRVFRASPGQRDGVPPRDFPSC